MEIELTRKQAIMWHRNMWNDMADEIEKCKKVVFVEEFKAQYCFSHNFLGIHNSCFLCAYAHYDCSKCPLQWDSTTKEYMCESKASVSDDQGLWMRCCNSTDWKEQAGLARQIANLPERQIGEI